MIRKFLALAILVQLSTVYAKAQSLLDNSLVPQSPEAASLGKFGIVPVTLYSGSANISIPVTEVKSTQLSLPISLSYNYSGYNPGEEASMVGLGWTLQAGGVITRVVKSKADENSTTPILHHWQDYADILDLTSNPDFMQSVAWGKVDVEPDIYIYNFNGHSGKFLMYNNRAYMFPKQDIQIVNNTAAGGGFTITAEDGTRYNFNSIETTTDLQHPSYNSAWFLTKMYSFDNTDVIYFTYTSTGHRVQNNFSEVYTQQIGGLNSTGSACSNGYNSGCDTWAVTSETAGAWITTMQLASISSNSTTVNFIPEAAERLDYTESNYALGEIDVYNKPANKLVKKFKLVHSYFGNTSGPTTCQLELVGVNDWGFNTRNATDSSVNNYTLSYYSQTGLYPKNTRGIDKWGYYNGADGNVMLFDQSLFAYTPLYPAANRSINTNYSTNGLLQQITYPTGGYTTFTYENNTVFNQSMPYVQQTYNASDIVPYVTNSTDSSVGSEIFTLNIAQSIHFSYERDVTGYPNGVLNNTSILKIYSLHYDSLTEEDTSTLIYISPHLNKVIDTASVTLYLTPGTYSYALTCDNTSFEAIVGFSYLGNTTTPYPGDPGPGMRVKTINSYDNINASTPAITKSYGYGTGAILLNSPGYGFSATQNVGCTVSWTTNNISSNSSTPLSTLISNQFYYPIVAEVQTDPTLGTSQTNYEYFSDGTDELGVLLSRQTAYAYNAGVQTPVSRKTNTYNIGVNPVNFWGFTYYMSQTTSTNGCGGGLPPTLVSPDMFDTITRTALFTAVSYALTSSYNQLIATNDITYGPTGLDSVTTHTDYYFDNQNYTMPTRTVLTNSKGQKVTSLTKYPMDYISSTCTTYHTVDSTMQVMRQNVTATYGYCVENRYTAADPVYNSTISTYGGVVANDPPLMAQIRDYPCEANYLPNSSTPATYISSNNNLDFTFCFNGSGSSDANGSISLMQDNNINKPIEQITTINESGTDYLLAATKTDYHTNTISGVGTQIVPNIFYQANLTPGVSVPYTSFVSTPSNYYTPRGFFTFDNNTTLIERNKVDDIYDCYIWDYNHQFPIAEVKNASPSNIAYTSFEADGSGNWTVPSTLRDTINYVTGTKSYVLSNGSITIGSLTSATTYIVSYWSKNGVYSIGGGSYITGKTINGWTYYEHTITGITSLTVSGTGNIDELRLYPKTAQMTTYTYEPLVGVSSQCDLNNRITYYFYDGLARLTEVKDQDLNVIKKVCYNQQGQPSTCVAIGFSNVVTSQGFIRNNCGTGLTGSTVTYTVPAGKYFGATQAAANQLAQNDVNANGQNYANATGTCSGTVAISATNYVSASGFTAVYTNTSTSQQYSFTIPSAGGSLGSVPAGTYNIAISKSGNVTYYLFGTCNSESTSGTSATLYNISVSTNNGCNTVIIDSDE